MNIRSLQIFQTVASLSNMSEAGRELFISQPAVSKSITDLEEQLGVQLFDRVGGKIQLNSVGQTFLVKVDELLSLYSKLEPSVQILEETAPIRIGASITVGTFLLPKLMKTFQKKYPLIHAECVIRNAKDLQDMLIEGKLDLAIIEGVISKKELTYVSLEAFPLSFFCPVNHPFANRVNVTLKEFLREPLLLRERGSSTRDTLDSAMLLQNVSVVPLWTSVNSGVLIQGVVHENGVSVLPFQLLEDALKAQTVALFEIEKLPLSGASQIVKHQNKKLTTPLQNFITIAEKIPTKHNL